jgi:hypothetical protein
VVGICEYTGEDPGKKIVHPAFYLVKKVLKVAQKGGWGTCEFVFVVKKNERRRSRGEVVCSSSLLSSDDFHQICVNVDFQRGMISFRSD